MSLDDWLKIIKQTKCRWSLPFTTINILKKTRAGSKSLHVGIFGSKIKKLNPSRRP
jgi:hypothetical protein